MSSPLAAPLAPLPGSPGPDAVLDAFLQAMAARGLTLYPEQEEAILELFAGRNVILNTPTGSGKSLVAAALHFKALCAGQYSVYTCPIKALVNEKFLSLCRDFGPENVGMMTGDASVNPRAKVLCCTAEILANIALTRGDRADVAAVIMDEFHYYSDDERGYAWQVPLLTLPQSRFLLMSATLGSTDYFERELTRLTGAPSLTVRSDRRPVPLSFEYSETPLPERVTQLLAEQRAPVYLVHFTQRAAAEAAQALMSLNICTKEEKAALATELERVKFNSPYGKDMKRWLRHGIGVHHAGLLPKYRILVEQLAQKGLLKLICGTDTLGVGINVPIRTVVFTQLWKYDGKKAAILSVLDFRQVSGRAGRAGFDDRGYVIAQAPEHMIENKRAEEKAAADPAKKRKLVKQRAPEGTIGWDAKTFDRLRTASPEELSSHFDVSHGMLLLVLSRDTDGCRAMRQLINDCHETPSKKKALRKRAWQLFRALLDRKIVEFLPVPPVGASLVDARACGSPLLSAVGLAKADVDARECAPNPVGASLDDARGTPASGGPTRKSLVSAVGPAEVDVPNPVGASLVDARACNSPLNGARGRPQGTPLRRKLRVNVELQDDFSLHQALSLYLIDTLPLLTSGKGEDTRATNPDYPFDVLTLCEAIVEDPDQILRRQVDKQKGLKIEEWKAAGIPYEERMAKLEEVEHPKPLREFLYETFNAFAAAHPWIEQENVRPKSIAREMFERYQSFSAYVREYGLERSEGLLLRHLMQVWKVLAQTVPDTAKTPEVIEMEDYFRELIRGIDSSLLDEWERLRNPDFVAADAAALPTRPASYDITRDDDAFRRLVRTAILGFLQDVAARDWEGATERLGSTVAGVAAPGPSAHLAESRRIEKEFTAYFEARGRFRLDPEGRAAKHTHFSEDTGQTAEDGKTWAIAQILADTEGANDWEARFTVSLAESRATNAAAVRFVELKPVGSFE